MSTKNTKKSSQNSVFGTHYSLDLESFSPLNILFRKAKWTSYSPPPLSFSSPRFAYHHLDMSESVAHDYWNIFEKGKMCQRKRHRQVYYNIYFHINNDNSVEKKAPWTICKRKQIANFSAASYIDGVFCSFHFHSLILHVFLFFFDSFIVSTYKPLFSLYFCPKVLCMMVVCHTLYSARTHDIRQFPYTRIHFIYQRAKAKKKKKHCFPSQTSSVGISKKWSRGQKTRNLNLHFEAAAHCKHKCS